MTRFKTQSRERRFLDAFRAAENLSVDSVDHGDKPDFVLKMGDTTVGLELREVVREEAIGLTPHRELESLRWRLVGQAVSAWTKLRLPHIHASVHFNENYPLRRYALDDLSDTLINVAVEYLPLEDETIRLHGTDCFARPFPLEVHTLGIARLRGLEAATWVPSDSGWVPSLGPDQIQIIIDQKNRKLSGYRRCADSFWLLLCADGFSVGGTFDLAPACVTHAFHCLFDRVGYFDRQRQATTWFRCGERDDSKA